MYSFSVRLHEDTLINDDPSVFGTIDLNIGDGYNEFSGKQYLNIYSFQSENGPQQTFM